MERVVLRGIGLRNGERRLEFCGVEGGARREEGFMAPSVKGGTETTS